MSSLLNAAPKTQHDASKEEAHHIQPAVTAVSPAAEARTATDAGVNAEKDNLNAENSSNDSAGVPPTACSATRPDPASQPRSMEQAFAAEMLNRQRGGGVAQIQPPQVIAKAEADTEAGTEPFNGAGHEADQAEEEEALAAVRRQQIVDDAMDKLFEDNTDEAFTNELPTLSRAGSVSDVHWMNTADSGMLLSASDASSSGTSAAAGTASEEEEEQFMHLNMYSLLADMAEEEELHRKTFTGRTSQPRDEHKAQEQGDDEEEEKDNREEQKDNAELQALATLEMQGYSGLERAFRRLPQPDSPPTSSSTTGPYAGRDRSLAMPERGVTNLGVKPRAAAGVATEEGASSSTPRLTATTSSAAAAAASTTAQTFARPNQQPSKALPSLALSRSSRKTAKPTPDEKTVLLPSQQASGLTRNQAPQAKEQGQQMSQAEMQHLMDFVFQRGFEHMGRIAGESLADPAAPAANVDVPVAAAATATPVPDKGTVEKTHDEMQDAFNKLVQHGRERQGNPTRTELEGAALSQAVAGATTTPITTAAPATTAATAGNSKAEGASAVATASKSRHPKDMDSVPKALVARERVRVARTYMEDELTDCQRQVGFAVKQMQTPSKLKTALKVLLAVPGVIIMLATGIARSARQQHRGPAQDDIPMNSDDSSDSGYESDY